MLSQSHLLQRVENTQRCRRLPVVKKGGREGGREGEKEVKFGADEILNAGGKGFTDEDIDLILQKGEAKTEEQTAKYQTNVQHNLAKFTLLDDTEERNLFEFEGEDYSNKRKDGRRTLPGFLPPLPARGTVTKRREGGREGGVDNCVLFFLFLNRSGKSNCVVKEKGREGGRKGKRKGRKETLSDAARATTTVPAAAAAAAVARQTPPAQNERKSSDRSSSSRGRNGEGHLSL
ncbi:hypothetical protein VYU27_006887 [Nannochloropsis oceanica]